MLNSLLFKSATPFPASHDLSPIRRTVLASDFADLVRPAYSTLPFPPLIFFPTDRSIFAVVSLFDVSRFITAGSSPDTQRLNAANSLLKLDYRRPDAMGRSRRRHVCLLMYAIHYHPTGPWSVVRTTSDGGCSSLTSAAFREPSSTGTL
jgi:hypothetical protein